MPQMRTWKKTVKALVSTVEKKPVPSGRESCQRLAQRAMRGSDGGDPAERAARPRGRERGVEEHDERRR